VCVMCRLFIDSNKLSADVRAHLQTENMSVTVLPYNDVVIQLASLVCREAGGTGKIWVIFCYGVFTNF